MDVDKRPMTTDADEQQPEVFIWFLENDKLSMSYICLYY